MTDVTVIVGTVFGGALATARAVGQELTRDGYSVRVVETPELEDLKRDDSAVLICTSTTGQGEIPPNLLPFYLNLRETLPVQPGRPFGVIVLGDSSYGDTFCGAGALVEEVFQELACRMVADTLCIDAMETTEPEIVAIPWCRNWVSMLSD